MNFGEGRWPLHTALAWVLTRDRLFTQRARPNDFCPYRSLDNFVVAEESFQAWRALFSTLAQGKIFATGCPATGNGSAGARVITVSELVPLDWSTVSGQPALMPSDDLRDNTDVTLGFSNVTVPSNGVLHHFPPGSVPIAFTSEHLGKPKEPDGPGYTSLSMAAYWIATEGGNRFLVATDTDAWRKAFDRLLCLIAGEEVQMVGRTEVGAPPIRIEGHRVSGLSVSYPYSDDQLMFGKSPYIHCYGLSESEEWENSFYDSLNSAGALEPEFTHLQVRNSDLKRCITFKTTNPRKLDEEQLNLGLSFRDELITRVQHGELTPSQAEAEAAAAGFGPLAQEPEPGAFDPMNKSRWTFVMALAWIAWRNIGRVRENCSDFCANRTIWRQQRWRGPVEQGRHFAEYDGWFLEALKGATVPGLEILESILRESGELPSKSVATVPDAEALLLSALSEGHIVAEAKDSLGKPVDIPERDWSYLKRFQENNEDVFKFESLDREPAYRDLKLKRDDLMRLWPTEQTLVAKVQPAPRLRAGGISYAEQDEPLLKDMHRLISNKEAPSVAAAAGMVLHKAVGLGNEESKITRLRKSYSKRFAG